MSGYARPEESGRNGAAGIVTTVAGEHCRFVVDVGFEAALGPLLVSGDPADWPLEEVKASRVRRVLRGTLTLADGAALDVHVKLYRAVRLSDRLRDGLSRSRGVRELDNLRAARARGLPCVRPLAAGSYTGSLGARSVLVTATEPGEPLPRGPLQKDTARAAGELLRLAHDRGLHARDLHPGNVLRRPDGSLLLLDLTSAALANPLEEDERARALAYFCLDLDSGVRDAAAAPLIDGYGASTACVERAVRLGRRLRGRGLGAFGRRATRQCRHTEVARKRSGERWYLHLPMREHHDAARALIAAPPPPVKQGRRGSVHLGETLVLKERQAAKARQLFRAAYWLDFAGVPCARPVALRTVRGRGEVVSERLRHPSLEAELAAGTLDGDALCTAARSLGDAVGRLHAHGLRNRDLKLDNLVRDPDTGAVAMVDLEGVRRKTQCDRRGQAADLGRLLAAFRHSGAPGGSTCIRAFVAGYIAARKCLNQPANLRRMSRLSEERASAWASAHPNTSAPGSGGSAGSATAADASTGGSPPP